MALTAKERQDFVDALRKNGAGDVELMSGTVVAGSVNADAKTCSVEVLWMDEPIEDVLLNVIESNVKGCYAIPADGSIVHLCSIDGPGIYAIVRCEEIKEVHVDVAELIKVKVAELDIAAGDRKLNGKNGAWVFDGGNNGGVPVSSKVAKRLSGVEQQVNTILQILKATTIPLAPSGTYAFASLYASVNPITPTTQEADIANNELKH
jgi:hypothetical protein